MATKVKCPKCGKEIVWGPESPFRPFCSEKCKTMDFGDWITERNGIWSPITDEDLEKEEVMNALIAANNNEQQ